MPKSKIYLCATGRFRKASELLREKQIQREIIKTGKAVNRKESE